MAYRGWVGSGELWYPPFELLSRSQRTVTYDHRGTGASLHRGDPITFDLPTLLIHGARDVIAPLANSEKLAQLIPHSELVIIDDAGHVPTVTRPTVVAEAMEKFIKALP